MMTSHLMPGAHLKLIRPAIPARPPQPKDDPEFPGPQFRRNPAYHLESSESIWFGQRFRSSPASGLQVFFFRQFAGDPTKGPTCNRSSAWAQFIVHLPGNACSLLLPHCLQIKPTTAASRSCAFAKLLFCAAMFSDLSCASRIARFTARGYQGASTAFSKT